MKKLGYVRSSYVVRLNRWAFRCMFFICRVLIAPVIFHDAYIVYATDVYDQYRYELMLTLLFLILPVILLNIYWFYVICYGYWKEGRNWVLRRFQQLRSYRDEIETRNREEITYSSRIVPRGLSVAERP